MGFVSFFIFCDFDFNSIITIENQTSNLITGASYGLHLDFLFACLLVGSFAQYRAHPFDFELCFGLGEAQERRTRHGSNGC